MAFTVSYRFSYKLIILKKNFTRSLWVNRLRIEFKSYLFYICILKFAYSIFNKWWSFVVGLESQQKRFFIFFFVNIPVSYTISLILDFFYYSINVLCFELKLHLSNTSLGIWSICWLMSFQCLNRCSHWNCMLLKNRNNRFMIVTNSV